MTLITQAEFSKRKSVTPAAVSQWKSEGRLKMVGKLIDFEATEESMLRNSSYRSKRVVPASQAGVKPVKDTVKPPSTVNAPAVYADGTIYDNPANLPTEVLDASSAIEQGAVDMARLTVRHIPFAKARPLVEEWIRLQRNGTVGGPGLPFSVADEEWPEPPLGYTHWRDHPLFAEPPVCETEWQDIEAEAKTEAGQ